MNSEDFTSFARRLQRAQWCGLLCWRHAVVSVAWYPIGRLGQAALSRTLLTPARLSRAAFNLVPETLYPLR